MHKHMIVLSIYVVVGLDSYLSTRSTQGAVGGNGHCVQVADMANVVGLQLAVSQVPNLATRAPC